VTHPRALAAALGVVLAVPALASGEEPAASRAPSASAAAPTPAQLLDRLAPTVVTVKYVLKTRLSMGGQSQDDESSTEARGVLVDPSGIVMLSNTHLEGAGGMMRRFRRQGVDMQATPSDFKVLFGNDPAEHDALLLGRESALGLAYVQILSVEGLRLQPADLSRTAAVEVGQSLWGVNRLGRGFDYAPTIDVLRVTGRVEKPRAMWDVSGTFSGVGLPVYDASGVAVGVLANQEGAEGASSGGGGGMMALLQGGGGQSFVLPLDTVRRSLEAAKKRAPVVLEKARAEAKPAEGTESPPPEKPSEPAPDQPK
jgi:hypothetical protein